MKFVSLKSRGGNYLVVASNVAWLRTAENGQTNVGIGSVATSALGNSISGFLSSLSSGGSASLVGGNTTKAQKIINAAIQQVSDLRGRLGETTRATVRKERSALRGFLIWAKEAELLEAVPAVELPRRNAGTRARRRRGSP